MKGFEAFRKKLPFFRGAKIVLVPLLALGSLCLGLAVVTMVTAVPQFFPRSPLISSIEPFLLPLSQLVLALILFLSVSAFWKKKNSYRERFGEGAYERGFRFALIGLPQFFVIAITSWAPLWSMHGIEPVNVLTGILNASMVPAVQEGFPWDILLRLFGALMILGIGLLGVRRSMKAFGFDYIASVYTYFPEESEVQHHDIYSIIRHPFYSSVLVAGISGFVFRLSPYSFFAAILLAAAIKIHLYVNEEKELVERFGPSYADYMKSVPALAPRMRDLKRYFIYITG